MNLSHRSPDKAHRRPQGGHFMRYALILLLGVFIGAGITLERAVQADRNASSAQTQT